MINQGNQNSVQAILDLQNGRLSPDYISEMVRRLWFEEDDYSEGSIAFHLALARFPPPQPIDFYVAAMALINHREAHKVPNLLKLCREDLGLWQTALEVEAAFRSSDTPPAELLQALDDTPDQFFQALSWLNEAVHLRRTNTGDRLEIRKRLHKALSVFQTISAFETGRTLLYLSQVESSYETALATAEKALEYFKICKNKHYQSDTKLAIDSIREKHKARRDTSRSRSIDLGYLIRPLMNASDTETLFQELIQVLSSRTFLALDHVTVLYKSVGGEHIVAAHHTSTMDQEVLSTSIDLGSGYRLVVSQAADPLALELILPLVKRELIRLSKSIQPTHSHYRRQFGKFTYYDSRMDEVLDLLEMAAKDQPEAAIMMRGEPGVGKTDLAYALHLQGCTKAGKFVVYDATTAVDKSFMVAELFGTVKGAFTDAQPRIGKIEEASHGTLFIDEIGELTPQCQALLLRVLQNRQYQRMGTHEVRPVTCRIILATNQPIEEWCQKPSQDVQPLFRPDLPSRFRHWIHIKSLHEIPDQIVPTAAAFLREQGDLTLSPEAEIFLRSMRWIGNYRSLQNTVGLAVNVAKSFGVNVVTPEIIHRAIGHHPLMFTPRTDFGETSMRSYPTAKSPGMFLPAIPGYPSAPVASSPLFPPIPSAWQPEAFRPFEPMPTTVPMFAPEMPKAVSVPVVDVSSAPVPVEVVQPELAELPKNTENVPPQIEEETVKPFLDPDEERQLHKQFLAQFKEIFDEFEFNRRKYFEFTILSNISQIIHLERFPRAKTFQLIVDGLIKSPYFKTPEGSSKIRSLGKIYQTLNPKWSPPDF